MSAKVNSLDLKGLEGYLVQVQVQVMEGMETFIIVGLPDASVKESRERVSAALHCMGYSLVTGQKIVETDNVKGALDLRQIIGQQFAKRVLEIAAAGGHHVMMEGPPGCGKSMLSDTFPTILPPLEFL